MKTMSSYSLEEAIVIARDTYKQIGSPRHPVPVDPILRYVEKVESLTQGRTHSIQVFTAAVKKTEYRGIWVRGLSESKIYISEELNDCWRKFVICKEAIHLLVDNDPARYAKNMRAQTVEAFEMFWPTQSRAPLTSEAMAAVVAFEVLYPWEHRSAISSPPEDMHKEARAFRVPERHLDAYFGCRYGALSEEINSGLGFV